MHLRYLTLAFQLQHYLTIKQSYISILFVLVLVTKFVGETFSLSLNDAISLCYVNMSVKTLNTV